MNRRLAGVAMFVAAGAALDARADTSDGAPIVSGAFNASYYAMRDQPDFGVGVASVNRGPLRIEARYNYEARHAASAFLGWKFGAGDAVTYEFTPLVGALFGASHGVIPAIEASIAYRAFDAYVETEYVFDRSDSDSNYFYAWSEVGWRPLDWLRVGIAGQRTRIVHTGRDLQRGPFVQFDAGWLTVGVYAFNPESASRYVIVSIGASF
jgi:hypothetical protein